MLEWVEAAGRIWLGSKCPDVHSPSYSSAKRLIGDGHATVEAYALAERTPVQH